MRRANVVVTLQMDDLLEIERVCLDGDAEGALQFVRERVKPQVDAARKGGCDPQFGLGRDLSREGKPDGPGG